MTWWYALEDKKYGPIQINELKQLFIQGVINAETLIWREGMESWSPLEKINELCVLKTLMPPPLPVHEKTDTPYAYIVASSWPRFFARCFDVLLETLLLSSLLSMIIGFFYPGFLEWAARPGASHLYGIICLPFALLFDALLYKISGNTPGKALLGLKVTTKDGNPLNFYQYLSRNFSLWISGLAFGLPVLYLFTTLYQSRRLRSGKEASYDQGEGFHVLIKPNRLIQKTVFGILFTILIFVLMVFNSMEQDAQKEVDWSQFTPLTEAEVKEYNKVHTSNSTQEYDDSFFTPLTDASKEKF